MNNQQDQNEVETLSAADAALLREHARSMADTQRLAHEWCVKTVGEVDGLDRWREAKMSARVVELAVEEADGFVTEAKAGLPAWRGMDIVAKLKSLHKRSSECVELIESLRTKHSHCTDAGNN